MDFDSLMNEEDFDDSAEQDQDSRNFQLTNEGFKRNVLEVAGLTPRATKEYLDLLGEDGLYRLAASSLKFQAILHHPDSNQLESTSDDRQIHEISQALSSVRDNDKLLEAVEQLGEADISVELDKVNRKIRLGRSKLGTNYRATLNLFSAMEKLTHKLLELGPVKIKVLPIAESFTLAQETIRESEDSFNTEIELLTDTGLTKAEEVSKLAEVQRRTFSILSAFACLDRDPLELVELLSDSKDLMTEAQRQLQLLQDSHDLDDDMPEFQSFASCSDQIVKLDLAFRRWLLDPKAFSGDNIRWTRDSIEQTTLWPWFNRKCLSSHDLLKLETMLHKHQIPPSWSAILDEKKEQLEPYSAGISDRDVQEYRKLLVLESAMCGRFPYMVDRLENDPLKTILTSIDLDAVNFHRVNLITVGAIPELIREWIVDEEDKIDKNLKNLRDKGDEELDDETQRALSNKHSVQCIQNFYKAANKSAKDYILTVHNGLPVLCDDQGNGLAFYAGYSTSEIHSKISLDFVHPKEVVRLGKLPSDPTLLDPYASSDINLRSSRFDIPSLIAIPSNPNDNYSHSAVILQAIDFEFNNVFRPWGVLVEEPQFKDSNLQSDSKRD